MKNFRKQKGFGLIQLLVVVTACGLLSSVVIFFVESYRERTRDARRLEDVDQIRKGLELYYTHAAGYPDSGVWASGRLSSCDGTNLVRVPRDPLALFSYKYQTVGKKSVGCGGTATVWSGYRFEFQTETDSNLGPAGTYCVKSAGGLVPGPCPKI